MNFWLKVIVLFIMLWLHIVDDYYLQGVLAKMKQKVWWKENVPADIYKNDYMVALIEHAFSWSFVVMIPIAVCMFLGICNGPYMYPIWLVWNTVIHAWIDNEKANKLEINLLGDQVIHCIQVIITWLSIIAFA